MRGRIRQTTLRDIASGALAVAFVVMLMVAIVLLLAEGCSVLDAWNEAKKSCREHGYLDAGLFHGEWVCSGIRNGQVVRVLLSEVEVADGQ